MPASNKAYYIHVLYPKDIFSHIIFQLKKLNQAIELAGGMTLLMEEKGDDGTLLEEGTVVMNCQESELTPRGVKWAKHVQELLQR